MTKGFTLDRPRRQTPSRTSPLLVDLEVRVEGQMSDPAASWRPTTLHSLETSDAGETFVLVMHHTTENLLPVLYKNNVGEDMSASDASSHSTL